MSALHRTDTSLLGRWWWTVDRWTLAAVALLLAFGGVMTLAASPAVAERIDVGSFHFIKRQAVFLGLGALTIFGVSLMSLKGVRRLAILTTLASLFLMLLTLMFGAEIKGATRWLSVGGFSLQPSEFVKPGLAVVAAWLFARQRMDERFPGFQMSIAIYLVTVAILLMQPDVGMTIVVSVVWGTQFFVAGLPLVFVGLIAVLFIGAGVAAYFTFDHVQLRVDRFFGPEADIGYQASRAIEAFQRGGIAGRGPGEGRVKEVLPDAHADFIFAVTGEEFGLLACLVLVGLFAFVVLRGFGRVMKRDDLFVLLAVTGLLSQFAVQALINMASSVSLIPPKGMTLPFISYGGSSTLALAVGMGMVLALTRERPDEGGGGYGR
ncbi:MAG: cell division protein FtsW [Rhodospirillales bacterium]|nr:cell division protein FtsW [Rhodospirillales bacterium]MBO6787226.1 cell division protein FtsW [Rhodospirillales bacterium]